MRLILYLVLASCSVCVHSGSYANSDGKKKLVRAYADRSSSERQFIGYFKKLIFGRGEEKEMTKTKIKYLPIYVPVPVYSDMKQPSGSDFYGAHQQKKKPVLEESEVNPNVPPRPSLPYPHTHRYDLPYGGQLHRQVLPFYYFSYLQQFMKPTQTDDSNLHHKPFEDDSGYDYLHDYSSDTVYNDGTEANDYDSVVIDNPELIIDPDKDRKEGDYLRKRKIYRKKNK